MKEFTEDNNFIYYQVSSLFDITATLFFVIPRNDEVKSTHIYDMKLDVFYSGSQPTV